MGDPNPKIPLKDGFFAEERKILDFRKRSWHQHPPGQIIYCIQGSIRVQTQTKSESRFWYLPAQQGIWVPPNLLHAAEIEAKSHFVSLYIEETLANKGSKEVMGFQVSNLLRELIMECSHTDFSKETISEKEKRLYLCMFDQLENAKHDTVNFPLPNDQRLQKLLNMLLKDPSNKDSVSELGKKVGASSKTLSRLLDTEFQLSFTDLRNRIRILHASKALDSNLPIVNVALSLGFSSQAAFTTLFKKYVGITPKALIEQKKLC